jgi:ribosomal protein L20A (L18A)
MRSHHPGESMHWFAPRFLIITALLILYSSLSFAQSEEQQQNQEKEPNRLSIIADLHEEVYGPEAIDGKKMNALAKAFQDAPRNLRYPILDTSEMGYYLGTLFDLVSANLVRSDEAFNFLEAQLRRSQGDGPRGGELKPHGLKEVLANVKEIQGDKNNALKDLLKLLVHDFVRRRDGKYYLRIFVCAARMNENQVRAFLSFGSFSSMDERMRGRYKELLSHHFNPEEIEEVKSIEPQEALERLYETLGSRIAESMTSGRYNMLPSFIEFPTHTVLRIFLDAKAKFNGDYHRIVASLDIPGLSMRDDFHRVLQRFASVNSRTHGLAVTQANHMFTFRNIEKALFESNNSKTLYYAYRLYHLGLTRAFSKKTQGICIKLLPTLMEQDLIIETLLRHMDYPPLTQEILLVTAAANRLRTEGSLNEAQTNAVTRMVDTFMDLQVFRVFGMSSMIDKREICHQFTIYLSLLNAVSRGERCAIIIKNVRQQKIALHMLFNELIKIYTLCETNPELRDRFDELLSNLGFDLDKTLAAYSNHQISQVREGIIDLRRRLRKSSSPKERLSTRALFTPDVKLAQAIALNTPHWALTFPELKIVMAPMLRSWEANTTWLIKVSQPAVESLRANRARILRGLLR